MARYLVVAHQTADSRELVEQVKILAANDASAEFVLLVPNTPVSQMLTQVAGGGITIAQRRAEDAKGRLEIAGARVSGMGVGNPSPLVAIDDEVRNHPNYYDAAIICTFPPGISRWLELDLVHQMEQKYGLPVIHVVAAAEHVRVRIPRRAQ